MKQLQNIIMLAVFLLASIPVIAGKHDAKATLIMRDGITIENVDLQLPKSNMANKIVIKDGKKRKIASTDIAKMMIWAPNYPNDVCELVYTKINFKPGVQASDKQKPVWVVLVTKGPFASYWESGWFEVGRICVHSFGYVL